MKVLNILKDNIVETEAGDTVDGPYQRRTGSCCEEKYLRKAVLFATSEDDPETLEALKVWALDNDKIEMLDELNCYCPMMVACIEVTVSNFHLSVIINNMFFQGYSRCIQILYAMNYRVPIAQEYADKISQIMSMKAITNNLHFYYILIFKGNRHIRMNKSPDKEDIPISVIGAKKKRREIFYLGEDPVTKFVRLKAYSNPHYLVTEFKAKLTSQVDNIWAFDPVRKALAIARFTELLSKYEQQYAQDYIEIMMVNINAVTFLFINFHHLEVRRVFNGHTKSHFEDG